MMRSLFVVLTLLVVVLSGCEKYNLKQPAYLHLNWKFFTQTSLQDSVEINSGYFNATSIAIEGERVKGNNVSISKDLGAQHVLFNSSGSLYVSLDVPMGDYTSFTSTVKIDNSTSPQAVLYGKVTRQTETLPLRIEFTNLSELIFNNINAFSLEKKKDYQLYIGLDVANLISNVSSIQWNECTVTNEGGIPTIIIRDGLNTQIYNEIKSELAESLKLNVE